MGESKKFESQVDDALLRGINSVCDLAESKLIGHINAGNLKAIQLYLSSHKKACFRPRVKEDLMAERISEIRYTVVKSRDELAELRQLKKEIEEMSGADAEKE